MIKKLLTIFSILLLIFTVSACKKQEQVFDSGERESIKVTKDTEKKSEEEKDAKEDKNNKIKEKEVDTLDWNIYRNKEFGFEFKYPKDYKLVEGEKRENNLLPNLSVIPVDNEKRNFISFNIVSYFYSKGYTSDSWINRLNSNSEAYKFYNTKHITFKKEEINGGVVTKLIHHDQPNGFTYHMGGWPEDSVTKEFFFDCDEFICGFSIHFNVKNKHQKAENEFDKIISTFKAVE